MSLRPETIAAEGEWLDAMRPCTDAEWLERLQWQVNNCSRPEFEKETARTVKSLADIVERQRMQLDDLRDTVVFMKRAIRLQNLVIESIISTCRSTASVKRKKPSSPKSSKAIQSVRRRARKA